MRTKRIAMAPQSRYWLALAVMVGLADQVIKGLVQALMPYGQTIPLTPFFNWGHWWNTGAAFSFLADSGGWQRYLFLCLTGIAAIVLTFLLCRPRPRLEALGYSLMLGGALGNGIDRLARGYVVDYLDIYWREWHWPAFNLADIALFLGVITFAMAALHERPSPGCPSDGMDAQNPPVRDMTLFGRLSPVLGCLLALTAGGLTTLSAAPFTLWWLGPVAVALVYVGIHALTPAQAALRGWCYGVGLFGSGTSWVFVAIHDYGDTGALLALFLTGVFVASLALFYAVPFWLYRRVTGPRLAFLSFAGAWVLSEWLRTWLFTGFPWLLLGTSQVDSPLAAWAPVGGVYFLSLITALTGTLGVELLRRRWWAAAPIAALWLTPLALPSQWTSPAGEPLRVALLQGNLAQSIKWTPEGQREAVNIYTLLARKQPDELDLMVWPEAALPMFEEKARPILERVQSNLSPDTALLTGILQRDGGDNYNGVIGLGNAEGQYRKVRLVPFGEYLPLKRLFADTIAFFDLPMPTMTPGAEAQGPIHAAGTTIGNAICYEIIYADRVAEQARDAELLLTVSNDTWFGRSIGPLQHLQMARLRALENGRYLIRATSNGVTAIVDPQGRVMARAPQFQATSLRGEVLPMVGNTPFTRTGSWPTWLLAALLVLPGWRFNTRRSG